MRLEQLQLRHSALLAPIAIALGSAALDVPCLAQRPCASDTVPPVVSTAGFRTNEESAFDVDGDHAVAVTGLLTTSRSIVMYDKVDGSWTEADRFQVDPGFSSAYQVRADIRGDVAIVAFINLFSSGPTGPVLFTIERDASGWRAPEVLELPSFVDPLILNVDVAVSGFNILVSNYQDDSVLVYSRVGGEYAYTGELPHAEPTIGRMVATDTRLLLASDTGAFEVWTRPTATAIFAPFAAGAVAGAPEMPESVAIADDVFAWQSDELIRLFEFNVERQELPMEVPALTPQSVPSTTTITEFAGVRLAGGHVMALLVEGLGSTAGQLAVGSRLDIIDRWVWDDRLDVTLNYNRASHFAFDGETASILFKGFNLCRAHFVSVLSPDLDCDADCVPDADQIADSAEAVDRNGNQRLDSCEQAGQVYCSPAVINSTGASAVLRIIGTPRPLSPDLLAVGQRMPPGSIALLVGAAQAGYVPMVGGGAGTLCLGPSQLGRFVDQVQPVGADGMAMVPIATDQIPNGGGNAMLAPGDTWFFQFWFRDQGSTSNLSDASALEIE